MEGLSSIRARSWWGISAFTLLVCFFLFSLAEAFDDVLFTNWWRQNIHLFTPLLILPLVLASRLRREKTWILLPVLILWVAHYFIIWFLHGIGRAGAGLFRLL